MSQSDIPESGHFARHVSRGKIVVRDDGVETVTVDAFRLRPTDDGLSGAWFESAGPDDVSRAQQLVHEWRSQQPPMTIRQSGRIALARTDLIKLAGQKYQRSLRVRHEPDKGAPSYAQVRGMSQDDLLLLDALARDAVIRLAKCL